tara:strand:- start:27012 stop:27350 length:339 start_codon:yes stop_codon:yes gene_type:complete
MADKEKFFKCSCYGEGMFVTRFEDENEYYFSMWSQGYYPRNMSLWQRIKFACKVLWTGEAWEDELVLEPKVVRELSEWIKDDLQEVKMEIRRKELEEAHRPRKDDGFVSVWD